MRKVSAETERRVAEIETDMRKLAGREITSPMLLAHYKRELFGDAQRCGVNVDWPSFEAAYEIAARDPIAPDAPKVEAVEDPASDGAKIDSRADANFEGENDASEAPRKRRGKVV